MPLNALVSNTGINTGTMDGALVPGVGKFLIVWGGMLTVAQLAAGYTACKASLIADSKRSKLNANKLIVFPIIRDFTNKKEANTEAKLADGLTQVTREGLPIYDLKIVTDMYLITQLRILNNKRIRYAIVDAGNQFLATTDMNGNLIGRSGKIFADGLDVTGFSNVSGETMIQLNAENAYETFDNAQAIQLDKAPNMLFKSLKDIQLYQAAPVTISIVAIAAVAAQAAAGGNPAVAAVAASPIGSSILHISGKMQSPNPNVLIDFYADYSGGPLGASVNNVVITQLSNGNNITPVSIAQNAAGYYDVNLGLVPSDSYLVNFPAPDVLDAAGISGIEATPFIYVKP